MAGSEQKDLDVAAVAPASAAVPTVVTVLVNASAVCTIAVAVGVIVTVFAPFPHCPFVLLCVAVAAVIAIVAASLLLFNVGCCLGAAECWLLPAGYRVATCIPSSAGLLLW